MVTGAATLVQTPKGGIVPVGGHIYGTSDHPQACLIFREAHSSFLLAGQSQEPGTCPFFTTA